MTGWHPQALAVALLTEAADYLDTLYKRHGITEQGMDPDKLRRAAEALPRWCPIAEFVMPANTNGYHRHAMLFQLAPPAFALRGFEIEGHPMPRVTGTQPVICEGYAQFAIIGRPNRRAVLRFYSASGSWLLDRVEYFMPLPAPRSP